LVSAVQYITGRGDRFIPVSNAGLGNVEIEQRLREVLASSGAQVVFTDLPAGSCNFAAARLLRERDDLVVVSGVNLPALLHFATREGVSPAEAAEEAVVRAGPALRLVSGVRRGH
jgi:PTS system N-acetylgalactosamine-specific IIA component